MNDYQLPPGWAVLDQNEAEILAIRVTYLGYLKIVVNPNENGKTLKRDAYPYSWLEKLLSPELVAQIVDAAYAVFWPDTNGREELEAAGAILPEHIQGTLRLPLAKGGYTYVQLGEQPKPNSHLNPLSGGLWELTAEGLICVSPLTMARIIWPDGSGHIAALDEQGAVKDYPPEFLAWARGINAVPWADYETSESTWALKFAPKKAENNE